MNISIISYLFSKFGVWTITFFKPFTFDIPFLIHFQHTNQMEQNLNKIFPHLPVCFHHHSDDRPTTDSSQSWTASQKWTFVHYNSYPPLSHFSVLLLTTMHSTWTFPKKFRSVLQKKPRIYLNKKSKITKICINIFKYFRIL